MRVIIKDHYDLLSEWAALYIIEKINRFQPTESKPFVIGLPTGSTPLGVYKKLIEYYQQNRISFKHVITFNMDEYAYLDPTHPQSYHYYMWSNFFDHIDIPRENVNILNGCAENLIEECERYEAKIKSVGIHLFLCGVGSDGHLAFNEPGSSLHSRTRMKTLCQETISANSRFFIDDEINAPSIALTVGISTILDSKEVVVLVNGAHKAQALQQCLEGNINNTWTITALQQHEKAIIVCDELSTKELKVKTVSYFNTLQKTTNMFGEPNDNDIEKYITRDDKIIIFSPHPDDDVIGVGGALQKFNKKNVQVAYMTPGSGGYDKKRYAYNPRIQEATLSLKILGYQESNIIFLPLPFYKDKKVTTADSEMISQYVQNFQPQHIFVCADSDPNKTHDTCYEIIRGARLNASLKYVWLYNSAWGEWGEGCEEEQSNPTSQYCTCLLDKQQMNHKVLSIMMHHSQDPPLVHYEDDRPFYEKIVSKNNSRFNPGLYEEVFQIITKEDFQ